MCYTIIMNVLEYAKGIEKLVDPMMVGKTHYLQTKLSKLPVCLQRKIVKSATKKADKMRHLNERLWIEGNTSIAYGRLAGEPDGDLFSLTFFPEEMKQALDVPLKDVAHYNVVSSRTGKFGAILDKVISFPFAQHMLSDSPGIHTHYGNEAALRKAVESIRFNKIKTLAQK